MVTLAGERYFADGRRELPDSRRLAILAVCAVEWGLFLADAVVETLDRIVGRTYREAARTCEGQLGDETAAVREALRAFAELGTALIGARDTGEALDGGIADGPGWEGLGDLVARAAALANTVASDPLNHMPGQGQTTQLLTLLIRHRRWWRRRRARSFRRCLRAPALSDVIRLWRWMRQRRRRNRLLIHSILTCFPAL